MKTSNALFGIAMVATTALAVVPSTVLFQGTMSKSGTALTGNHKVEIDLCTSDVVDADDCEQIFTNDNVPFAKGYYSVLLGKDIALPSFDKQYYLQVSVDGSTPDSRVALFSATSALDALRADTAKVALKATSVEANVAVTSLNGIKNAVTIAAGSGMSITKSGATLTLNSNLTDISNNSLTTKSAQITSFTPGAGGIATCDATNSGMILNISNSINVCTKVNGVFQWAGLGFSGPTITPDFGSIKVDSFTPGAGGIATCDATNSGLILNISNSLNVCSKVDGVFQWSGLGLDGDDTNVSHKSVKIAPITIGAGGFATCNQSLEGTIYYITGSSGGNFQGCTKTSATTYEWKTLNNP